MHKILLFTGLILAFCGIVTVGSISLLLVLKLAVIILPLVILFKLVRNKLLHRRSENHFRWILLRTRQVARDNFPKVKLLDVTFVEGRADECRPKYSPKQGPKQNNYSSNYHASDGALIRGVNAKQKLFRAHFYHCLSSCILNQYQASSGFFGLYCL